MRCRARDGSSFPPHLQTELELRDALKEQEEAPMAEHCTFMSCLGGLNAGLAFTHTHSSQVKPSQTIHKSSFVCCFACAFASTLETLTRRNIIISLFSDFSISIFIIPSHVIHQTERKNENRKGEKNEFSNNIIMSRQGSLQNSSIIIMFMFVRVPVVSCRDGTGGVLFCSVLLSCVVCPHVYE